MKYDFDEAVDTLAEQLRDIELNVVTGYTLADAIREGSSVTEQDFNKFGGGFKACALSAAYIAARARNYIKA